MRHDPTLASVLAAYTQPITSVRWQIEPRGADPAIVQVCADSLGLSVKGADEEPGPVRRRGVHWMEHLPAALGGVLTYGHAAFEPVYDTSTGKALLATLGERPQLSIAEIEADSEGNLKSVTQYGDVLEPTPAPISSDRLLWYVRGKEGANWAGTSLLRHAFGSWLLKQDALRVQATAHRRFGAGVPVAEALPGTSPTQAQIDAAQRVASSVRAGDTAGVGMPPGFRLRIQGVEGTFPDGLPAIRYHDEQMARGALTSILDLGSTQNGSRALGDNFAEILAMAQQGTAKVIAETATQLCVRLTDYNIGEDAPPPAVTCGAIGDDEQALAQSVAQLIAAGAVVVDDDLEAWLRQVFRAPQKGTPRAAPASPAPPAPAPAPAGQPTTARRRPSRVTAATEPGTAPVEPRALTPIEEASGFDPEESDTAQEEIVAALVAAWLLVQAAQRAELAAQITAILAAAGVAGLAGLAVTTTDAATVLGAAMLEAADAGVRLATAEAARQGVEITGAVPDADAIEAVATALAESMGQSTTAAAARQAVTLAAPIPAVGAGLPDVAARDVAAGVDAYLAGLPNTWTEAQMGGAVHGGIGAGRAAVFIARPPERLFASEYRDRSVCDPCSELDGTEFDTLAEAMAVYPLGWYTACRGRERCRGSVIAVWDDTQVGG